MHELKLYRGVICDDIALDSLKIGTLKLFFYPK